MATVLDRRNFEQDEISFVVLTGLHAIAIAVEALPSIAVSETATRLVNRLRDDGVIGPHVMTGLAFRGPRSPDPEATDALYDSCAYVAVEDLQESAVANAEAFLDEVEAAEPKALAIATFERLNLKK